MFPRAGNGARRIWMLLRKAGEQLDVLIAMAGVGEDELDRRF